MKESKMTLGEAVDKFCIIRNEVIATNEAMTAILEAAIKAKHGIDASNALNQISSESKKRLTAIVDEEMHKLIDDATGAKEE